MISSVSKTVASNGVQVITAEMPHVYSAGLSVFVFAGSRDEPEHQPGIAHFTEHLSSAACHGIKDSDPALFVAQSEMSAFTTKEIFAVMTRVTSPLEPQIVRLLKAVFDLSVSRQDLLYQRQKVRQEIAMTFRDCDLLAPILLEKEVWGGHQLGRATVGDSSYIEKATIDDAKEYLASVLHPSRVVVSASGRLKHAEAVERCEALFDGRVGTHDCITRRQPYIDRQEEPQLCYIPSKSLTYVALGVKCFSRRSEDFPALSVLASLCDRVLASALRQCAWIRPQRTRVRLHGYEDTGLLLITINVGDARDDQIVGTLRVIIEVLRDLKRGSFSPDLFSALKRHQHDAYLFKNESTKYVSGWLGETALYEIEPQTPVEVAGHINCLTMKRCVEVAERVFQPQRITTAIIGPNERQANDEQIVSLLRALLE